MDRLTLTISILHYFYFVFSFSNPRFLKPPNFSNQFSFPLDILLSKFIPDFLNLPISRTNFCFPSGYVLLMLKSRRNDIQKTCFALNPSVLIIITIHSIGNQTKVAFSQTQVFTSIQVTTFKTDVVFQWFECCRW